MEPVFTLPYSEFVVAQRLASIFPGKDGYSIFVPVSRQEKGIDLVLARKSPGSSRVVTIQVKASRTYSPPSPKRASTRRRFAFYLWFNRFDVQDVADFWLLVGMFPPDEGRTRKGGRSWWTPVLLCYTSAEMREFMDRVKTRDGRPDKMFAIGFDEADQVHWTRGHQEATDPEISKFLLSQRVETIKEALGT